MKNTFLLTTSLYIICMVLSCNLSAKENKNYEKFRQEFMSEIFEELNARISDEIETLGYLDRTQIFGDKSTDLQLNSSYHKGKLNAYVDLYNDWSNSLNN